jgi:hypothetical protein
LKTKNSDRVHLQLSRGLLYSTPPFYPLTVKTVLVMAAAVVVAVAMVKME